MNRQEEQLTLWEYISPKKTITKPIRLIELFAGIGAQAKSLEILGVPFEHYKICEQYDYSFCEECELYSKETECCLVEPPLLEKDLEREVEIDEINFN